MDNKWEPASPIISVIIPVYNVEKYIRKCLDSVIKQTITNIEIIIINDGSNDNSLKVCEEYKQKDGRIRLYSQDNIGLGITRNRGISYANGQYLYFVDSDDYLELNYLESLYNVAEKTKADIVQGESIMFFENGRDAILEGDYSKIGRYSINPETSEVFLRKIFFTHIYKHYAWNKLYKSSFVKSNKIFFGDNKRIFAEDTWFQLQTFHYSPNIAFASGSYYYYRQRETSIMHSEKKDLLKRQAIMVKDYLEFLNVNNGSKLEYKICSMIAMDVFTMEALNQINIGGDFLGYRNAMKNFNSYVEMKNSVSSFNKIKAYKLETKKFRRIYLRIISLLYKQNLGLLAEYVVWLTYKLTKG